MEFPKTYRTNLGWAMCVGALIALIAGQGTITRSAIVGLVVVGAIGATWSAWEHKWFRGRLKSIAILVLVWGGMGAFGWWVWPNVEAEGFQVIFKAEFMNMNKNLGDHFFWVLHPTGYGDTISPVALLAFLQIHSSYKHSVNISSYSLATKTDNCGWIYLTPIDLRGRKLLWGYAGLNSAQMIKSESSFNHLWTKSIPAYDTQFGMLAFDTKVECPVQKGSLVQFKIDLVESNGKTSSYTSPEMIVRDDFTGGSSVGQENVASLEFNGYSVNANQAHRKLFSDPLPTTIREEEKGTASLFAGKIVTIFLEDGAYVEAPKPHPAP